MKRILIVLSLFMLMGQCTFADVSANWAQIFDFNFSCTFATTTTPITTCTAQGDVFGPLSTVGDAVSSEVLRNILRINCDGTTVYSDGAIVRRVLNGLVTYSIISAGGVYHINLQDAPFSTDPNPKTVTASLEFPGNSIPGSCTITASSVANSGVTR